MPSPAPADPRPGPPAAHVLASLERLDRRIERDLGGSRPEELRRMRGSHGRLLDLIDPSGSRPSQLAAGGWITKQAVGQRLRELEEMGWVEVSADPADGRARLVRRTPAGDRARRLAIEAVASMEAEWAGAVGQERYETFRSVLRELGEGTGGRSPAR